MTPTRRAPRGLLATYWWLIAATLVATVAAAAGVASRSPVTYTSSAQVVVLPEPTIGVPIQPQMATESAIASSGAVASLAMPNLGPDAGEGASGLSVSVVLATNVLQISYSAPTAQDAYRGAVAFSNAYVTYRNTGQKTNVAEVVTSPAVPTSGSGSNLLLILGVGGFAGLALGVGAAWAWDRLTDRLRSAADVERLAGATVLAELPRWSRSARAFAPAGRPAEAAGFMATRLHALAGGRRHGVTLVVTTPRRGGGTTTLAANVARTLALQGCEVVLVGADVHAPRTHQSFSTFASPGLIDVLTGVCTLDDAVQPTDYAGLRVLAAGTAPELERPLNVDQLRLVLAQLAAGAVVVVDAPPLLSWPVSFILASHANAVLIVADLRAGTRADASAAAGLLGEGVAVGWVSNRPRRTRRRLRARLGRMPFPVRRRRAHARVSFDDSTPVEPVIRVP